MRKPKTGKLGVMKAKDMFIEDAKQVFDRKTGNYLGLERPGTYIQPELNIDEPEEAEQIEKPNPNQQSLF